MAVTVVILRQGSLTKLIESLAVTADYQDIGGVIDVRNSTRVGLYLDVVINDSMGLMVTGVGKKRPYDSEEYQVDGIGTVVLADIDNNKYLEFDSGTLAYVQFKIKASIVGTTAAIINVNLDQKAR